MGVTVRTPEIDEAIISGLSEGKPLAEIYGLYDGSGNLRYIGKANSAAKRLASHMRDARRRETPLYHWIRKNGRPEMRVLEVCEGDWRVAERRLIADARARGERLLNVADGGDEPFCPPETRSKNGSALNARMAADPRAYKLREDKRRLMVAWKAGQLSEYAKSRLREAARINPKLFACFAGI